MNIDLLSCKSDVLYYYIHKVTPTRAMGLGPVMVSSGYGAVRPAPVYVQAPPDQIGVAAAAIPPEVPQQPALTPEQKEQLRLEDLKQVIFTTFFFYNYDYIYHINIQFILAW